MIKMDICIDSWRKHNDFVFLNMMDVLNFHVAPFLIFQVSGVSSVAATTMSRTSRTTSSTRKASKKKTCWFSWMTVRYACRCCYHRRLAKVLTDSHIPTYSEQGNTTVPPRRISKTPLLESLSIVRRVIVSLFTTVATVGTSKIPTGTKLWVYVACCSAIL